jgi:hypothetical protein
MFVRKIIKRSAPSARYFSKNDDNFNPFSVGMDKQKGTDKSTVSKIMSFFAKPKVKGTKSQEVDPKVG